MKSNIDTLDSIIRFNKNEINKFDSPSYYTNTIHLDKGTYYYLLNDYEKLDLQERVKRPQKRWDDLV